MPPTLYVPGNLEHTEWSEPQAVLDKIVPIDYIMSWLDARVGKAGQSPADRILIVQSSTGSGKSTVMPAEIFHRFYEKTNRRSIACTQPRVLTAMDIPKNQIVPYNTAEALRKLGSNRTPLVMGENIGYQTGAESKKPVRGLIFMTIGIIVQQMNIMSDEDFMRKYAFIIIDEAHERSTNTDTTLYNLKKFIAANHKKVDCPFLIVTSATFNAKKYADYLLSDIKKGRYSNIIKVKGSTFPIKEEFLTYDSPNYVKSCVDKVISVHTRNANDFLTEAEYKELEKSELRTFIVDADPEVVKDGERPRVFRDIIIFVSGAGDIKSIIKELDSLNSRNPFFKKYPIFPLQLTGDVVGAQSSDYRNLFSDIDKLRIDVYEGGGEWKGKQWKGNKGKMVKKTPTRRVIVSTNVGETGITIDTLRYVIDSGWVNSSEYAPCYNAEMLINKPVTQGMYKQRRGRSGRKDKGYSFAMYTKETLDLLQEDQYPDIIKEDISLVLLNLLIRDVDSENRNNNETLNKLLNDEKFIKAVSNAKINLYNIDLLDMPSADMLHSSMEKLFTMGAIDLNSVPTPVGFIMNKIRMIPIESVRMILSGYAWGVSISDLITVAAFIEEREGSLFPRALEKNYIRAVYKGEFSIFSLCKGYNYGGENAQLRDQLLTVCDFTKYLVVYHKFQNKLSKIVGVEAEGSEHLSDLKEWCDSIGISYSRIIEISEARDGIIHNLATIGLDPFHNYDKSLHSVSESYSNYDFLDYIKGIKKCVFEGYKLNVAVYNQTTKTYYTRKARLPLTIESPYFTKVSDIYGGDYNPKYILSANIIIRKDSRSNMYAANASNITVLDGFIEYDTNFDSIL
jgi:HrpA-like RNA helicase